MKRLKLEKGMSLVEILVALAILGLVGVGIIGFFTDSFKFQKRSQDTVVAQKAAESIMEQLKNESFDLSTIDNSLGIDTSVFDDFNFTTDSGYEGGESSGLKIEWSAPDTIKNSDNKTVLSLYKVTVTVYNSKDSSILGTVTGSVTIKGEGYTDDIDDVENVYWISLVANGGILIYEADGEQCYITDFSVKEDESYNEAFERVSGGKPFPIAQKDGANFNGWVDESGNMVDLGAKVDAGKVLTASYSVKSYTVTLDPNGGSFDL